MQNWRWQSKGGRNNPPPSLGRPGVVKDEEASVYASNLPWRATEQDIEAFFAQAGSIVDIRRKSNKDGEPSVGHFSAHGSGLVRSLCAWAMCEHA